MKKTCLIIGAVLLQIVFVLITVYFIQATPYNKVIAKLNDRNWSGAQDMCRSMLWKNPHNHKYLGLLLYANIRNAFDHDMELMSEMYESDTGKINATLYDGYPLYTILCEALAMEKARGALEFGLYTADISPEEGERDFVQRVNDSFSINFQGADDLARAAKYLSKIGVSRLKLDKGDMTDNFYHNCFLVVQSSLGNSKADKILMKKYNIDSSVPELFPYCGAGLQKSLKKLLQSDPDISELQGAFVYLAIMKATDMIREIHNKYPMITDIERYLDDEDVDGKEHDSRLDAYRAWLTANPHMIDEESNPHYMKQMRKVLDDNMHFGMEVSLLQHEEEVAPILLTLTAYDTWSSKFVMWPFVYHEGEFVPLTFTDQSTPISSDYMVTLYQPGNGSSGEVFFMGAIKSESEEYQKTEQRYNPKKNKFFDQWTGRYEYYGGYEYVTVSSFRRTRVLTENGKYQLNGTEAVLLEEIEDDDFDNVYRRAAVLR